MKNIYSLKKSSDFDFIISTGNKIYSKNLILFYIDVNLEQKIGISIPKKIAKRAVDRNKNKRIIKSIISSNIELLNNKKIVIISRKSFLGLNFIDKERELKNIFNKVKKNGK